MDGKMITKPRKVNNKWIVSIKNLWTNKTIKSYKFIDRNTAQTFYTKKAKKLAMRGM